MTMTDLESPAERAKEITEANFGTVIARDGDIMTIEVPVDVAIELAAPLLGTLVPAEEPSTASTAGPSTSTYPAHPAVRAP